MNLELEDLNTPPDRHEPDTGDAMGDPAGWPIPTPVTEGDATPYPTHCLPEGMAAAVAEVAERVMVDPALPGTAFLGVYAATVGPMTSVIIRATWRRRCNLYLGVIAPTGGGKTPSITPAMDPLRELERQAQERAEQERHEAKVMLPALEAELKAMQSAKVPNVRDMAVLSRKVEDLHRAVTRQTRLIVDDSTPEQLAELLADNGGRMAVVNDEGALLAHMMGRYAAQPNLDVWLKGWDGSPLTVDRKGSNGRSGTAIHIPEPLLTIVLAIQPRTVRDLGQEQHRHLVDRGAVGRLMLAWPPDNIGTRMLSGQPDVPYRHVDTWNAAVMAEHARGPVVLAFSDHAARAFEAWHDGLEAELRPSGIYADVREFAFKLRDQVPRIAGLLARARRAAQVEPEDVAQAAALGDYHLSHARAVVEAWAGGPTDVALRLLAKIPKMAPGPDGLIRFTVRDAVRDLHVKTATALDALEVLDAHGYIRPADPGIGYGAAGRGVGKRSPVIVVNPRGVHPQATP